jgi:hypothetical protein
VLHVDAGLFHSIYSVHRRHGVTMTYPLHATIATQSQRDIMSRKLFILRSLETRLGRRDGCGHGDKMHRLICWVGMSVGIDVHSLVAKVILQTLWMNGCNARRNKADIALVA